METDIVMSREDSLKLVKALDKCGSQIVKGYYSLIGLVARAKETKLYLSVPMDDGTEETYSNIYEMCNVRYGMSRGTVGNLLKIFKECYDKETYKPLPQYAGLSYGQLLKALPNRNEYGKPVEKSLSTGEDDSETGEDDSEQTTEPENRGGTNMLYGRAREYTSQWFDGFSGADRFTLSITANTITIKKA